ncbi:MAG: prefoldin, molecular chaperone implicated in de novo protein folding, alpha subunit [uncultured archaeon A07HN63]|nr:MAG: prefoldin, molecular chaperone implicated in de novo protein folding, alpha subunit [uncultured archaeon A07HN63]
MSDDSAGHSHAVDDVSESAADATDGSASTDDSADGDSGGGTDGDDGGDGGDRGIESLRTVADYQFGSGAGEVLFPPDENIEIRRSSSGRPRQLLADGRRLVSYGVDGRFTLGLAGGRRLVAAFDHPRCRVVVGDDSEPFVRDGKNAFAKFVREADPEIRPGDEVAVVHERGDLLAVGRAELSADAMADFDSGMAVKVREGSDE